MYAANAQHSNRPAPYASYEQSYSLPAQQVMSLSTGGYCPYPFPIEAGREASLVRPKLMEFRPEIVPEWVRSLMNLIEYNQMSWILDDSEAHVQHSRKSVNFLDEHEHGSLLNPILVLDDNEIHQHQTWHGRMHPREGSETEVSHPKFGYAMPPYRVSESQVGAPHGFTPNEQKYTYPQTIDPNTTTAHVDASVVQGRNDEKSSQRERGAPS